MRVLIILILGATDPAPDGAEAPTRIDVTVPQPCAEADDDTVGGEIVVCGEREPQARYRLRSVDPKPGSTLPRAEVHLAEGTALAVETESADLGMARSQRAMVRLKFKF